LLAGKIPRLRGIAKGASGALFALLAKYKNRLVGADGVDRIGEFIGPKKLSGSYRSNSGRES